MKTTLSVVIAFCFFVASNFAADEKELPKLPATAMELIKELKKTKRIYTTWEIKLSYVKEADLPLLIELLDSTESCAYSVMSESSRLPRGSSTVGNEAAYLIESFMKRYYPTKLVSDRDLPNKDALKRWYRKWSHLKKLAESGPRA